MIKYEVVAIGFYSYVICYVRIGWRKIMTNTDKLKANLDSEDMVMLIKNGVLVLDMCKCCIQTKGSCNGYCDWSIRK